MNVSKAATIWIDYHNTHSKKIPCDHVSSSSIGSARSVETHIEADGQGMIFSQ